MHKRVQDFAINAGRQGGAFETNCSAEQVFEWLKASRIQVTQETPASLSAKPILKDGRPGADIMTLHVSPGQRLPARVAIDVQRHIKPGEHPLVANNPMTIPPLLGLLLKVSRADPGWQPV